MKEEILNAVKVLKNGGIILYPTDTLWGIGCDATNYKAVQKVYKLKKRIGTNSLIILLDKEEKIINYVKNIPEILWDLLKNVDSPTTIIYPNAKNLAKNVIAKDKSIAIRIVRDEFCKKLINLFNKPIVSTSANISGEPTPIIFHNISNEIIENVDYVVKIDHDKLNKVKPSTIIKLKENGEYDVLRQ
ncbi:MAG: threonylcarbamoyl-AMP synthase [Bacteroidales bacterium]|nr:threonylcarbamoyl-AMP synthase [Bacteroidales bacterium]